MKKLWMAALLAVAGFGCAAQVEEADELDGLESFLATDTDTRYLIKFKDEKVGRGLLGESGSRIEKELGPQRAVAARIPAHAAAALKHNKHFEYVEEDVKRQPLAQTTPYGISMVQAPDVWATATGANRKVCVIDSGFYLGHEDLQSSGVTGYPAGWSTDACGHGSHVTGTIAALNNDRGVVGVLPNGVSLHVVKVFGDDCAWTYASDLVDALNRCQAAGANVVSMSLGGGRASNTERSAFDQAWTNGVLSIAAAGNDGTTALSYPASYASVVSVAAIDSARAVADFSQKNAEVDLAAPGVAVLSSVGWLDSSTVKVGTTTVTGSLIEGAARGSATGALAFGGLCDSVGSWSGKVVLCDRGSIAFVDKVNNARSGGAVAVAIANNVPGGFAGTLGTGVTSPLVALAISQEDGTVLKGLLGQSATVASTLAKPASGYEAWDGTSMATPHVSGVAALVWSANPAWSNAQVRNALEGSAQDLGSAGRDNSYGHGLVQAKAALDLLGGGGGTPPPNTAPTAAFSASCTQLSCTFTDASTDADGTITAWAWDFGDGTSATTRNPSHTYAVAGSYTVKLIVTDDDAATGSTSKAVTVTTSTPSLSLVATGFKVKGRQYVDLGWNGASSASVDVYRNGAKVVTTANDGYHTDATGKRGGGSYTYEVCEAGTGTCSNAVTVSF